MPKFLAEDDDQFAVSFNAESEEEARAICTANDWCLIGEIGAIVGSEGAAEELCAALNEAMGATKH